MTVITSIHLLINLDEGEARVLSTLLDHLNVKALDPEQERVYTLLRLALVNARLP